MRAHARNTDPDTSHAAAAGIGDLTKNQAAVMQCFRMATKDLLDEELIRAYNNGQRAMRWPRQSESGIRSRRAELVALDLLEAHSKRTMSTGGQGRTFKIKEPT